MKFGVREICDVVLKAKANQKVGNKIFYKGEPVIYFDTLKTSSLEGAATTVYAQGGRGNSRLVAWEGERTVTFTMEDALISPAGFMILSGAGLIEATTSKPIYVHVTEQTDSTELSMSGSNLQLDIILKQTPAEHDDADIYVMLLDDNGEVSSEPFKAKKATIAATETTAAKTVYRITFDTADNNYTPYSTQMNGTVPLAELVAEWTDNNKTTVKKYKESKIPVLVDYYTEKKSGAQQIDITPDKFGGNYYLEASTLFRTQAGVDMPAEFIIPNCKIQSNFTFTMASSGDPSSFTFTMDAFPDYTRFDRSKKVLAAIQIIDQGIGTTELERESTLAGFTHHADVDGAIVIDKDTTFGTAPANSIAVSTTETPQESGDGENSGNSGNTGG